MLRRLGIAGRLALVSALVLLAAGFVIERVTAAEIAGALAQPGGEVAMARARRLVLAGTVTALGGAVAMSVLASFLLTRPLRDLTRAAFAMAKGDLDTRAPEAGDGEIPRLARAMNRVAARLSRTIDELRGERDLLAGILDGMTEGVLVLDHDRKVTVANRALLAMAHAGPDAKGRSAMEIVRSAALSEALDRAAAGDEPVVHEIDLAGPLPRKLLVRVSRLRDAPRSGLLAVFHDVTELRRLETIRTDFVANVSHELRTPVTAIGTAAETLLGGALQKPDDALEFALVIDRQATRLRQLVDDLLDLAKLEAKSFRLTLAPIDVRPVVEHVARLLGEAARRRGTELTIDLPPRLPRAVADRRALEQVLTNLVDNAVKYAGDGAHVRIALGATDREVIVSVADDGPGIPPQHQGRIFERFYRVDAGRSRALGGTGLGLAIVKHLVELLRGEVELDSDPGRGACFRVRLPRAPSDPPDPPSSTPDPSP